MSKPRMRITGVLALLFVLAACAAPPTIPSGQPCSTAAFTVTDDFDGARRGDCQVVSDNRVVLYIRPENEPPINDSPWFSFRIAPNTTTTAEIVLRYFGGHHRYIPKISYDGEVWEALDESSVEVMRRGPRATFSLPLNSESVYVSAQELKLPHHTEEWTRRMAEETPASMFVLGESAQGRPIYVLDVSSDNRDVLMITGRQHPPEVSGAFAFEAFAETVFGDSDLATRFRERFRIVAIPLLNPDGVVAGHWRNNTGGIDLNRDWGPFTQPETRLAGRLLETMEAGDYKVRAFLDFHSTSRNVFYTQNDDFPTDPLGFTETWLNNAAARITDYDFDNSRNPVSDQANGKNFMYRRYGIPAVTYEVGDETDRDAAQSAARVFAEELMKLMLEQEY